MKVMMLFILMELAALIMSWPLCFGWHPELVWPFFICFIGGFVLTMIVMSTREFWYAVYDVRKD